MYDVNIWFPLQAAAHIHRFLTLDENVLRMSEESSEGLLKLTKHKFTFLLSC